MKTKKNRRRKKMGANIDIVSAQRSVFDTDNLVYFNERINEKKNEETKLMGIEENVYCHH